MSGSSPLPFQQVGVSQIEFQVLPGLEVGSYAKKTIRPGSFLGPDKLISAVRLIRPKRGKNEVAMATKPPYNNLQF